MRAIAHGASYPVAILALGCMIVALGGTAHFGGCISMHLNDVWNGVGSCASASQLGVRLTYLLFGAYTGWAVFGIAAWWLVSHSHRPY